LREAVGESSQPEESTEDVVIRVWLATQKVKPAAEAAGISWATAKKIIDAYNERANGDE
jgi:hypothetical protein